MLIAGKDFFPLHSAPNFLSPSCYLKTCMQPLLLQNFSSSQFFMCLLSCYAIINYLIIKMNYTLLSPQRQYGKFREFGLYLHRPEEVIRMQLSIYLPAKSRIMLILFFSCLQIVRSVVHIHTFFYRRSGVFFLRVLVHNVSIRTLHWKNETRS